MTDPQKSNPSDAFSPTERAWFRSPLRGVR